MKTTVVNIHRSEYDVYIGREGHGHDGFWGNPYGGIKDGGRERAIALYKEYFLKRLRVDPIFMTKVQFLRGKRIGCFCAPKPCHGDVIVDYLDIEPGVKPYVDKLIANGFYTFSSCDGGNGHVCNKRMIRIDVDKPMNYSISEYGEKKCFTRFTELSHFVESQGWTYCSVRLIKNYVVGNDKKTDTIVHFELVWN